MIVSCFLSTDYDAITLHSWMGDVGDHETATHHHSTAQQALGLWTTREALRHTRCTRSWSQETPQCNVTGGSQIAELLKMAAMHIWDEFPRKVFEAVNSCLCDLKQTTAPCGGWVFICCGDSKYHWWSQVEVDKPSLKPPSSHPLCKSFQPRELTPSEMRETQPTPTLWTRSVMADFQLLMPLPQPWNWCGSDHRWRWSHQLYVCRHWRCSSVQPEGHHHWK